MIGELVEWRAVPGFSRYQASSDGRVRSWCQKKVRVLKQSKNPNGYYYVILVDDNGRRYGKKVCAAVAAAFLGQRPPGHDIRHLDGNADNNSASNLAYGTRAENMADCRRNGNAPIGSRHGRAKLNEAEARAIRQSTERAIDLAYKFGVSGSVISGIRNRKAWTHA